MLYEPVSRYIQQPASYVMRSISNPEIIDSIIRSDQFTQGSLYVSNLEGVQNLATLKKLKVTSILTCAEGYKLNHPQNVIPNYKYFPLPENPMFELDEYFTASSDFLKNSLKNSNCIIHCLTGQSKSVAVVIAFLIKYHGMELNEALTYVKRKKKLVNLCPRYLESLKQFQKYLQSSSSFKKQKRINSTRKTSTTKNVQNLKENGSIDDLKAFKAQQSKEKSIKSSNQRKQKIQESQKSIKNVKNEGQLKSSYNFSEYQSNILSVNNNKDTDNQKGSREITSKKSKSIKQNDSEASHSIFGHTQAIRFDQVISQNHVQYVGVKRELKNSRNSLKKEVGSNIVLNSKIYSQSVEFSQNNVDNIEINKKNQKSFLSREKSSSSQQKLNNKTEQSEVKSQNKSLMIFTKERSKSKITEMDENNINFINIFNPENDQQNKSYISNFSKGNQREKSRKASSLSHYESKQSRIRTTSDKFQLSKLLSCPFEISPSKKKYFEEVNEELNLNIKQISEFYESEISGSKLQFLNKLRTLKLQVSVPSQ